MHRPSSVFVLANRRSLLAFTALRVVLGVIMAAHGFQKLANPGHFFEVLASKGAPLPELLGWLAIAGETLGGLGLVFGLLTPIAAFGVAATMLVAIFMVHLPNGLFAANGGFEYPLVLLMSSLWYMAAGGGPYSLDALLRTVREDRASRAEPIARAVPSSYHTGRRGESEPVEPVTEAGIESFPASDPPAHHQQH